MKNIQPILIINLLLLLAPTLVCAQQDTETGTQQIVTSEEENDQININMEEVEMMEFVRSMSSLLKKNFVITSKLKGKVNIISP